MILSRVPYPSRALATNRWAVNAVDAPASSKVSGELLETRRRADQSIGTLSPPPGRRSRCLKPSSESTTQPSRSRRRRRSQQAALGAIGERRGPSRQRRSFAGVQDAVNWSGLLLWPVISGQVLLV